MAQCAAIPRRSVQEHARPLVRLGRAILRRPTPAGTIPQAAVAPRRDARAAHVVTRRHDMTEPAPALLHAAIRRYLEHAAPMGDTGPYFPPVAVNLLA